MLKISIDLIVSDERESEIIRSCGMRYRHLVKYIETKMVDMFKADKIDVTLSGVHVVVCPDPQEMLQNKAALAITSKKFKKGVVNAKVGA